MYKALVSRVKKKKATPHLDYYIRCMENGGLMREHILFNTSTYGGLCIAVAYERLDDDLLDDFMPTEEDREWLRWEGHSLSYWGSGTNDGALGQLTTLRGDILLLMAAIKGEL